MNYLYRVAADLVNFVLFDVLHRHQPVIAGRTGREVIDVTQTWRHDPTRTIDQYVTDVAAASGLLQ